MNISILIPIYKYMEAQAVMSLIPMLLTWQKAGHRMKLFFNTSNNIACARNKLFQCALKDNPDSDYILWLDSDHEYSYESLVKLIERMNEHNLQMLSATYLTRTSDHIAHVPLNYKETGVTKIKYIAGLKDPQQCYAVGFGFVVFKTAMIKDLAEKNKNVLFMMNPDLTVGEDVYFCELARKAGYEIYYDPTVMIGHIATVINK